MSKNKGTPEKQDKQDDKQDDKQEWYEPGLRFTCTQCGNCCTGPTGFVWFSHDELTRMSEWVGLTGDEFLERYCRVIGRRWSLGEIWNEDIQGYDCVFLRRDHDGRALCGIYEARPTQCRTWPFWPENLKSEKAYRRNTSNCPGSQAGLEGQGDFVPVEHIRIRRDATPQ